MEDSFWEVVLKRLQRQFLCCFPLQNIEWQEIKLLTWDQQQELIDSTCAHPLNQKYPVKLSYQLNFLKRLIALLEQKCTEVHDVIYESYCRVQAEAVQDVIEKYAYKHYLVDDMQFSLRESKSFVASGTTGLCSWQASLALADYLLHNAEIVREKIVMELGAGTGLCGFFVASGCGARQVLLTDGSAECVELMRENISRNFINAKEVSKGTFTTEHQVLSAAVLSWGEIQAATALHALKPDVLLAADVVYDDSVFEDLTNAIDYTFDLTKNQTKMFLAATVRNEHTLNKFLCLLKNLKFSCEELSIISIEQSNLYWDRSTPVKIFKITRSL